jgi:hypothetical protein
MSFAVQFLDDVVREYFEANGVEANVVGGRREVARNINQGADRASRVVFGWGNEAGSLGRLSPTKWPGHRGEMSDNARSLANVEFLYTVSVWARDKVSPEDDKAQFSATVALLEQVIRAVHEEAVGQYAWANLRLVRPTAERLFGCEVRAELTHLFPLYDAPPGMSTPSNTVTPALVAVPPNLIPDP